MTEQQETTPGGVSPLPWRGEGRNIFDADGNKVYITSPEFIVQAANEHAALVQERDALRAVLKEFEWHLHGENCPVCKWHKSIGHQSGCALAAALSLREEEEIK